MHIYAHQKSHASMFVVLCSAVLSRLVVSDSVTPWTVACQASSVHGIFQARTLWQIDGETVADFISLGSKITADDDCSHEIKRRLLLGRKVMINLDSILKSRDITLPTKVRLVKAMVSSSHVWM